MTHMFDDFLTRLLHLISRDTSASRLQDDDGYVTAPMALQYPITERSRRMMRMARARSS